MCIFSGYTLYHQAWSLAVHLIDHICPSTIGKMYRGDRKYCTLHSILIVGIMEIEPNLRQTNIYIIYIYTLHTTIFNMQRFIINNYISLMHWCLILTHSNVQILKATQCWRTLDFESTTHHNIACGRYGNYHEYYVGNFFTRLWISPWIKSISTELDVALRVLASQLSGHCDVINSRFDVINRT